MTTNKITILLVEDVAEDAHFVTDALPSESYEFMEVATSMQQAESMLKVKQPDIAILDIQLGKSMDGLTLAHKIGQRTSGKFPFFFLTSLTDRSIFASAKSSSPSNYLIKPFNPLELEYAIELAIENFAQSEEKLSQGGIVRIHDHFFIKHGKNLIKLKVSSITHIKVDGRYSEIYANDKRFVCRKSLNDLQKIFPEDLFFRPHRNFLVNKQFVDVVNVSELTVYLTSGDFVTISTRYLETVKKLFPIIT